MYTKTCLVNIKIQTTNKEWKVAVKKSLIGGSETVKRRKHTIPNHAAQQHPNNIPQVYVLI